MLSPANHSARSAAIPDVRHNGLKLVWSRDWPQEQTIAQAVVGQAPASRQWRSEEVRKLVSLTLRAAAVMAPLLWLVHVFLWR